MTCVTTNSGTVIKTLQVAQTCSHKPFDQLLMDFIALKPYGDKEHCSKLMTSSQNGSKSSLVAWKET